MADDHAGRLPEQGMIITVLTREDVVITDPQRLMAAARRAAQVQDPELSDDQAIVEVSDVYDAISALKDAYGSAASDHRDVCTGTPPQRLMHGGTGLLPGDRIRGRPDGLSPAGTITLIVMDEPRPLQDYGCALPDVTDLFAGPAQRAGSGDVDDHPRLREGTDNIGTARHSRAEADAGLPHDENSTEEA